MIKGILFLIAIVILFIPAMTGMFDAMCYFYLSHTCTGIVYENSARLMVLWLFTGAGVMLAIMFGHL